MLPRHQGAGSRLTGSGMALCVHTCPCDRAGVTPEGASWTFSDVGGGWEWDEARVSSPMSPSAALGGCEDGRWGGGLSWGT